MQSFFEIGPLDSEKIFEGFLSYMGMGWTEKKSQEKKSRKKVTEKKSQEIKSKEKKSQL